MTRPFALVVLGVAALVGLVLLLPVSRQEVERPPLGPADGFDLPAEDTGRVKVGEAAPDFTLEAHSGDTLTLSDYRGLKNVVLVFYRGHW